MLMSSKLKPYFENYCQPKIIYDLDALDRRSRVF